MLTVQQRPSFNRTSQSGVKPTQPASAVTPSTPLSSVQFAGERDQVEIRRQARPAPARKSIISPWFEAGVGAGIAISGFPLHIIPILGNAIAIILHAFGGALMLHALYRGVSSSIKQHQNAKNDSDHDARSHRSNRFDTLDHAQERHSHRSNSPDPRGRNAKDAPGLHRDSQGRNTNTLGRAVGNPQLGVSQAAGNGFAQSGIGGVLGSGLGQSLAYGAAAGAASSATQEGMSHLIHPDHPHGASTDAAQHTDNTDSSHAESTHDSDHNRAEQTDHDNQQDMDSHHDPADSHDADPDYGDVDQDYGDSGSFDGGGGADFSDVGDGDGIHSLFSGLFS
jgi:hypothetical protein